MERYIEYLRKQGNEESTVKSKVGLVRKYMGADDLEKALRGNSLSSKTKVYKAIADYKASQGVENGHEKKMSRTYAIRHNVDYMLRTKQRDTKYVPWSEVMKRRDAYIAAHKKSDSAAVQQRILLLRLYTELPPLRLTDYKQLRYDDDGSNNYVEGNTLVFRRYKTAKKYGTNVVDIPPRITKMIRALQQHAASDRVFTIDIEYALRTTLHMTINTLRKIYVSDILPTKSAEERNNIARIMGHSLSTQINVYQRNSTTT